MTGDALYLSLYNASEKGWKKLFTRLHDHLQNDERGQKFFERFK